MALDDIKVKLAFDKSEIESFIKEFGAAPTAGVAGFAAPTAGGAVGGGVADFLGTKGFGGVIKGLGLAGIALNQSVEFLGKIKNVLEEASPALKGTFELFGAAFRLFFKPFGDFLSALLRPMAIWLIRMAVNFNKLFQKFFPKPGEEAKEAIVGKGVTQEGFKDIQERAGDQLEKDWSDFISRVFGSETLGNIIGALGRVTFDFLVGLGEVLVEGFLFPLGKFIGETFIRPLMNIGTEMGASLRGVVDNILAAITENPIGDLVIGTINDGLALLSAALGDLLAGNFEFPTANELLQDFVGNLQTRIEKAKKFITTWFSENLSSSKIGSIFQGVLDAITGVADTIGGFIQRVIKFFAGIRVDIERFFVGNFPIFGDVFAPLPRFSFPEFQAGGVMTKNGLAMLHAGETVSRPGQAGNVTGNFNPTININVTGEMDERELAEKISTVMQEEYKRFTSMQGGVFA